MGISTRKPGIDSASPRGMATLLRAASTLEPLGLDADFQSTLWGSQSWPQPAFSRCASLRARRFPPREMFPRRTVPGSCERVVFHGPSVPISANRAAKPVKWLGSETAGSTKRRIADRTEA